MEFFKNLNLLTKFQLALFLVSTITLSIMSLIGYFEGKKSLTNKGFEILNIITENKKKEIENYFLQNKNLILTLASNPNTIHAMMDFEQSFKEINKDELISNQISSSLEKFYSLEFSPVLAYNSLQKNIKTKFIPDEPNRIKLQYNYIANNPNPINYKYLLNQSASGDNYDKVHFFHHPSFLSYFQKFGYDDIFLIDLKGNIVYSTAKKTDFATNLLSGPYRNSNAGRLFRRTTKAKEESFVSFEDYEHYNPSFYRPASFLATNIYSSEKKKIGVLMFQLSNNRLTEIISNKQQWEKDGLGTSGEVVLIAPDFKLRNDTRLLLTDALNYQQNIKGKLDDNTVELIKRLNTTVFLRKYKTKAVVDALNGERGNKAEIDILGNGVLDVYGPVNILGNNWALITEINGTEIFGSAIAFRNQLLLVSALLFISITALGYYLAKSLSEPMRKIQREITMLAEGTFPKPSSKIYKDELGKIDQAMNTLIANMQDVANFAEDIGKGSHNYDFTAKGEKDVLGNALMKMSDNLRKVSIEEFERNWVNTGTALFGEILRNNNADVEQLAAATMPEIVRYLKANMGAFYVYNETAKKIKPLTAYAYDKPKYLDKSFEPGEGLIGQVFLEQQKIFIKEIPQDYSEIGSGLGYARPRNILVVPIKLNEQIYGVIEVASFEIFKPYEITFVETISEDIATTITGIRANEETKRLLKETQNVAEQLRLQEEEMRQNFEELMATQEEMKFRQQQIDILLTEGLEDTGELDIDKKVKVSLLDKKVKDAIMRQKSLLDNVIINNKIKEKTVVSKVEQLAKKNGTD